MGSNTRDPSQNVAARATKFSVALIRAGSIPAACADSSERATSFARVPGPFARQAANVLSAALALRRMRRHRPDGYRRQRAR